MLGEETFLALTLLNQKRLKLKRLLKLVVFYRKKRLEHWSFLKEQTGFQIISQQAPK
jgi:hypothetical protein